MQKARGSRGFVIALLVGVILLVITGIALLGAYVYLSGQVDAPVVHASPLDGVHSGGVAPDLAVLALAGEPDDRIIRAALDAGEVETAYAGLAYSVLLPDTLRSGHWLLIGDRFRATEPARAVAANLAALDLAALSPALGDMARADVSLQVARNLASLEKPAAAHLALAQAENVARYSLVLLPAQRSSILERVEASYRRMGDDQAAQAIRRELNEPALGPGVKVEPRAQILPELRGGVVLTPAVVAAIAARQKAAAAMAARWLSSAPSGRTALAEDLGKALQAEDIVRSQFHAEVKGRPPAEGLALLHDRLAWLTIKYRVARGAYGVDLIPEWNSVAADIRMELASAYTDLVNGYGQQLDTLAPADASAARVELLRQALLMVRLGLFPDPAAEQALSDQLTEASRELWTRQGSVGLVNALQESQGQRFYLLSGSDASRAGGTAQPRR